MSLKATELSQEDKETIRRFIFGPFLEEWRDPVTGQISNGDATIAERIGKSVAVVGAYTSAIVEEHFNIISEINGHAISYEPMREGPPAHLLTEDQVRMIRKAKELGGRFWGVKDIAKELGVSDNLVSLVGNRQHMNHVKD